MRWPSRCSPTSRTTTRRARWARVVKAVRVLLRALLLGAAGGRVLAAGAARQRGPRPPARPGPRAALPSPAAPTAAHRLFAQPDRRIHSSVPLRCPLSTAASAHVRRCAARPRPAAAGGVWGGPLVLGLAGPHARHRHRGLPPGLHGRQRALHGRRRRHAARRLAGHHAARGPRGGGGWVHRWPARASGCRPWWRSRGAPRRASASATLGARLRVPRRRPHPRRPRAPPPRCSHGGERGRGRRARGRGAV